MVDVPDSLRTVSTATLERQDGRYVLEVPNDGATTPAVERGETYRVAILPARQSGSAEGDQSVEAHADSDGSEQSPPVEEGERRRVSIESIGDQGDGIARIERGYVVIVRGGEPGDNLEVEIGNVKQRYAFAEIIEED
jgi:predicted RNA-binding protein with TRAM domain